MNINRTRITKERFIGIGFGVVIFGVFVAAAAIAGAWVLNSPIGGTPDVVEKIDEIKMGAIVFGVAVFFAIIAYPRPALLKRAPLAILAVFICWLIAWKFMFYCEYEHLHAQGIDLYKVLQNANPH